MKIERCVVGPIEENCYIVDVSGELLVIDPGANAEEIIEKLAGRGIKYIALTHGHWDHIGAVSALVAKTHAKVAASELDVERIENCKNDYVKSQPDGLPKVDIKLKDGDSLQVGDATFDVIETPGHTQGSLCFYNKKEHVLFSGDTLFAGGRHGRCDFEESSLDNMISSLRDKLSLLPDETIIYPGHEEKSTMQKERELNQYIV